MIESDRQIIAANVPGSLPTLEVALTFFSHLHPESDVLLPPGPTLQVFKMLQELADRRKAAAEGGDS